MSFLLFNNLLTENLPDAVSLLLIGVSLIGLSVLLRRIFVSANPGEIHDTVTEERV